VVFVPQSGDAFCRRIPTTQASSAVVAKAEQDYERSLAIQKKETVKKIELF
jgi:chemotaxis protein CheD